MVKDYVKRVEQRKTQDITGLISNVNDRRIMTMIWMAKHWEQNWSLNQK